MTGVWREAGDSCPCCERPFQGIMHYPRVRILTADRLPLPEVLDEYSDEALARRAVPGRTDPLNRTEELARAVARWDVSAWLESVEATAGQDLRPAELLADWPEGRFEWTRALAGTPFSVGFIEGEPSGKDRRCTFDVLLPGPSLGSAGGPTLVHVGSLARLTYRGLVAVENV
ncbi:MAG: hypothetical protein WD557_12905 [Dehalococcoidia bacterium]